MRKTILRPDQVTELVRLYEGGAQVHDLKPLFSIGDTTVVRVLKEQGVELRPPRTIMKESRLKLTGNESAFDAITEESAYWAGFLMADGCVTQSKRGGAPSIAVGLKADDYHHLEKLRDFVRGSHRICRYFNEGHKASLTFRSQKIANSLARFGIVPRKSLVARVFILESNRHFWRGMIDGDGCLSRHAGSPCLSLVGSRSIIEQFYDFVVSICPNFSRKIHPHHRVWTLHVVGFHALSVIRFLYEGCTVALDRKNQKAIEFMGDYCPPERRNWRTLTLQELDDLRAEHGGWKGVAEHLGIRGTYLTRLLRRLGDKRDWRGNGRHQNKFTRSHQGD
jgi:hypothetical protein